MTWAPRSETSPDGRLRIDRLPHPDPRTATEAEGWWGVELIATATGEKLAELTGAHEWPAEGGIRMKLHGIWVTVAPDLAGFTAADEPRPRPIAELAAWDEARAAARRRRAEERPAPKRFGDTRTAAWLSLLALILLWGGFIAAIIWGVWGAFRRFNGG